MEPNSRLDDNRTRRARLLDLWQTLWRNAPTLFRVADRAAWLYDLWSDK
jgi:hypothetical protein